MRLDAPPRPALVRPRPPDLFYCGGLPASARARQAVGVRMWLRLGSPTNPHSLDPQPPLTHTCSPQDAYLPQRLLDKLMYTYNYVEMARVTGAACELVWICRFEAMTRGWVADCKGGGGHGVEQHKDQQRVPQRTLQ